MRKHFLILMLLTLLPFAGWAQGVNMANFEFLMTSGQNYVYSGAVPAITVTVKNTTTVPATPLTTADYDLQYYKDGVAIESSAVKAAGTYSVVAKAKANSLTYTGQTAAIEFNITPKPLTVKYWDGDSYEATYELTAINFGEAMPTLDKTKLQVTGYVDAADAELLNVDGFTYNQPNTNANADKNGTLFDEDGAYEYELGGLTAGSNYSFTYPKIKLKIKQVPFAETPANVTSETRSYFTYAVNKKGANAFTYNAAAQTPTYTVKYIDAQGVEHNLTETTQEGAANVKDFKVMYQADADGEAYGDGYATARADVKNASWYLGKIVAEPTGNFADSYVLPETEIVGTATVSAFEFQIAPKPVTIFVENHAGKVYDGKQIAVTRVDGGDIEITGATIQIPSLESADVATLMPNVKAHFAKSEYNFVTPTASTINTTTVLTAQQAAVLNSLGQKNGTAAYAAGNHPDSDADCTAYNDNLTATKIGTTDYSVPAVPADAGSYKLKAYTIGGGLGANYVVTASSFIEVGSYAIAKRPVKVTAQDQTFVYNGEKQNLNTDRIWTGAGKTVEFSAIEENVNSGVVAGEEATLATLFNIKKNGTYDIQNVGTAAYENGIMIEPKADTKNYVITPVSGSVIVTKQQVVVIGPTFTKEYGYQLTAADLVPVKTAEVDLGNHLSFIIKNSDGDEFEVGDYLPISAGNYTVEIDPESIEIPANANYELDRVENGKITITTKALQFVVKPQTLPKTAPATDLVQGENYVTITGLKSGEKLLFDIIAGDNFDTSDEDADGIDDAVSVKLYTAAEIATMVENEEITAAEAATYANANYTLAAGDITQGKLFVVAAGTIVLNRSEVNLADFINSNKSNAEDDYKKVTFSDRALAAETWQAYVLPFAVSPAELCESGLGYVIVNVLKPTSTASNVKFGYTMQTIPAHTPFLMKTASAKNMTDLRLDNRIIEAVPEDATEIVAQNSAKDVNFYGNYATKKGPFADNEYVMYIAPGENNKWVNSYSGDLSAMSGYLVLPESNTNAPIFTVEDANGTTSILGVTADGRIVEAEGWYTLNGVKLQGVPTQKGIYIHNGKKLVVK